MRFPRFRLRTILIAEAVAALGLGGGIMWHRCVSLREQAASHAAEERKWSQVEQSLKKDLQEDIEWVRKVAPESQRRHEEERIAHNSATTQTISQLVTYHAEMKRKYEYAAAHPWLPVEPDRPPP
jgi:hypothetical protein